MHFWEWRAEMKSFLKFLAVLVVLLLFAGADSILEHIIAMF